MLTYIVYFRVVAYICLTVTVSSNALALSFDTFVLVLTLNKTHNHVIEMRRLKRVSITQVIVRDGEHIAFTLITIADR